MRYDDDYVRPDAPFWGRIIVVLAVITAVPVVLWGTTAFVRSYVARPKVPTYHSLTTTAVVEAPKPTAADIQAAAQPAAPSQPTKTAEATTNALAGAKGDAIGPTGDRSRTTDVTATANQPKVANATPAAPLGPAWPTAPAASKQQPVTTGSITPQGPSARSLAAADPAKNTEAAPAQVQPAWPTPSPMPQTAAAKPITGPIPVPQHRPRTAAMAPEKPPPWYNPKAAAAAARNAAAVPVPQQRPVEVATAVPEPIAASEIAPTSEALPPAPPIAGPIPLPTRRPRDLAMAHGAAPVPRTRPVAAPETAPSTDGADFPWNYDPAASR